jgi:hypothetical protein
VHVYLQTDRLILRRFTEEDVDNLFELNSDPEVMRYLTGGKPTPREEIRDDIIPFHLSVYARSADFGTWAARARPTASSLAGSTSVPPPAGTSTWATGCAGPSGARDTRPRDHGRSSSMASPVSACGGCSRTR